MERGSSFGVRDASETRVSKPALAFDVIVPTIGRATLRDLLLSLERANGPRPNRIFVIDDRRAPDRPLSLAGLDAAFAALVTILAADGRGPAAARNLGWRTARAPWIAFLDDDVVVDADWFARVRIDLANLPANAAASQGRIVVPLPHDRRPTDWVRNVAALETAPYITADCIFRRCDLIAVGGFDERFPRAYREDSDLARRILARGRTIERGSRTARHPARAVGPWVSVALQAGNADDVLIESLHGPDWNHAEGRSPIPAYRITVAAAAIAIGAAALWLARTLRFAWARIAPGPRTVPEIATMLVTSAAIPFAALGYRIAARIALADALRDRARAPKPSPAAVFFDRDGTLIEDVPGNRDPAAVRPMPGAREALLRLRERGTLTAIVTNQSAVADGRLTFAELDAIDARVDELLGPFDAILACTHAADAGCACRKPEPGLLLRALDRFALDASDCILIGDIESDVLAARRSGMRAILVPTAATRRDEIERAPSVARTLERAVDLILGPA